MIFLGTSPVTGDLLFALEDEDGVYFSDLNQFQGIEIPPNIKAIIAVPNEGEGEVDE